MLIYYNLLDCVPFVQAVKNLLQPYLEQGWNIFKTSFSVSGVAKLQMTKKIQKHAFFCLFPKRHGDLYKSLRSQLMGDLSLIFCRLAISGETKIRSHEIENPETVKKVLGLDANSLYLHAIAQNNPTGYFCCYKEEEDFRPDPCSKFAFQSYQWLSYVANEKNTFLQTRFNTQPTMLCRAHAGPARAARTGPVPIWLRALQWSRMGLPHEFYNY